MRVVVNAASECRLRFAYIWAGRSQSTEPGVGQTILCVKGDCVWNKMLYSQQMFAKNSADTTNVRFEKWIIFMEISVLQNINTMIEC